MPPAEVHPVDLATALMEVAPCTEQLARVTAPLSPEMPPANANDELLFSADTVQLVAVQPDTVPTEAPAMPPARVALLSDEADTVQLVAVQPDTVPPEVPAMPPA